MKPRQNANRKHGKWEVISTLDTCYMCVMYDTFNALDFNY